MIGTLQIRSRPLRLGLLVNLRDKNSIEKAIEINSSVWGGYYNPLIPVFERIPQQWSNQLSRTPGAADIFLGYIRAFDPDVLVNCTAAQPPNFVNSSGLKVIPSIDIWKNDHWGELKAFWSIGIFDVLDHIFEKHFRFVEKFPHFVKLLAPVAKDRLFWGAAFGLIPGPLQKLIVERFGKALDITKEKADFGTLKKILQSPNILYPLRIARYALETTNRRHSPWDRNNLLFMDARKTLDIVDYWNLRASGRTVIPVPRQFLDNNELRLLIIDFLKFANRPLKQNPEIEISGTFICSRSETFAEMEAYATQISAGTKDPPKLSLQHWYPRIWDDWGRDADHVEPVGTYFEEQEIDLSVKSDRIHFQALIPEFVDPFGISDEPRYANDIQTRVYGSAEHVASVLPPMAGHNVMRAISEIGSAREEWRVGRDGLVKLVSWKSPGYLNLPLGHDVFFAWLKDLGWEVEASSPGLIAKQMFAQLGGWVAWFNEHALRFLEEMSAGKRGSRGADINEIRNRLVSADPDAQLRLSGKHLFDQLLDRKVFVIGHENQCPRCFRHSWHSLRDLDNTLTCPRCLHAYRADQAVPKGKWRYKTAGPFSIDGYADGAYCVLSAINMFGHNLHSLALTPATSFRATKKPGGVLEADFGMLWREGNIKGESDGVIFGECKSFGKFEAIDFDRMNHIAAEFPGAVLVFATFRKDLEKSELAAIKSIAKRGRKHWKAGRPINPVCILTGHELMSHFGPPYCWKALHVAEKHSRIVGLMEFCDATQQIHLGLPSWRDDWHKMWDRRHARRVARLRAATQVTAVGS
jgi:hypothetical protein